MNATRFASSRPAVQTEQAQPMRGGRDGVQRVQSDDQVEEAAEAAGGKGQALSDEAHPLRTLEGHEEDTQQA
jgi:hypothetical protein